jgi:hypothetical protein
MLIGDPSIFAIESDVTKAYERLSFRALGFFLIHIGGFCYGVRSSEATMLANSFETVRERIILRGKHTASFATEPNAGSIADAYRDAIFAPDQEDEEFFGIPQPEFADFFCSDILVWAPDGDEAFDDGSHVLHFDVENRVRLIGFKSNREGYHHNPTTLRDIWLDADYFYGVLQQWHDAFEAEWKALPKISKADEGTASV